MFQKYLFGLLLAAALVATPFAFSAFAGESGDVPCACCGVACSCDECVCDDRGCACDTGGDCACDPFCCATCCGSEEE